jgi:tetratricopeptide (TPR) repeat protein
MPCASAKVSCSVIRRRILPFLITLVAVPCVWSQSTTPVQSEPNPTWAGRRIVTLVGFGDYFSLGANGEGKLIQPEGLGVNIVAVVQRVEGDRIWIKANGAGDEAVGWVNKSSAILLDNAVLYFTSRIEHKPKDWDAYLRRAESEHALNQRDAALADYTRAIELHPDEPFLFLRRGREFRIAKACPQAAADFEETARLKPQWAEAYNMAAGVYVDCPDPTRRDPQKAIALIERAIALSPNPTYLTVLALAYFRSGNVERAVATQGQALKSPNFPPGYREDAGQQLQKYEAALAAQKH